MFPTWTSELDAHLRRLVVDDGLTPRQAAPVLGRPAGAVELRAKLLKIVPAARQDWDDAAVARLRKLFDDGATQEAMAAELDRPMHGIRWKLDELELKRGRGVPTVPLRSVVLPRPRPAPPRPATARIGTGRPAVPRAPPAVLKPKPTTFVPYRESARFAVDAARAKARTAAAKAKADADAILAEAARAAREAKVQAAALVKAEKAEAERVRRIEAAEAKRLERERTKLAREAAAAEERRRRAVERAEAKRLAAAAAAAEKRELVELEARRAHALAVAEGRGGNVVGAMVRRVAAAPKPKRIATREDALSVRTSAAEAIARFMAERGVTRVQLDPTEAAITGLRLKGYSVVRDGNDFVVDGRHRLATCDELKDFAERRAVEIPSFLQAAE